MSLQKHAVQILSTYLAVLLGSLLILHIWPGEAGLWGTTALAVAGALLAWWFNRRLRLPTAIETTGLASAETRVIWGVSGIAIILVIQLIGTWLESLLFYAPAPTLAQETTALHSVPLYALALVWALPLLQEYAFRRVIFGNLASVTGVFGAALISGLLFALATDPSHWLTGTLVGIAYAYLYKQTGSVQTPLIAHIGVLALTLGYAIWN
ncbi:CPBP family intramembrane glutamic endopeptidase [Lacticaseibacillus camelliae]|uniref:Metal-dependent membrane protease n=1 Tax=Lacticaseibacillus camelliae DSM 22697 = JCM 13995 TaxID=1423730 RepID=A0A0R2F428_9LACO|nr:CPBP family intramembrane glutamic endopeptidase [Lacticaseibacillus camelliae]KRN23022.1 metal-dependent membrane protease [Lacticaseibacillus camelliae DSM 22697 = JCM 13995]